jgi:NADH dehydrogenase FAD-containing subunit
LAALPAGAPVVVVGGGLTGIETAGELAEQRPELSVTLISSSRIAAGLHDRARTRILRVLGRLSVGVVEERRATRVDEHGVQLADGRVLGAACVIVATASAVPELARSSGLPTDPSGRRPANRCR